MLKRIQLATKEVAHLNINFSVELVDPEHLIVYTQRGKFDFKADHDRLIIVLVSYTSGFHNYSYDHIDKCWRSISDGHDMRGMYVRDFLHHCVGCPNLND